MTKKIEFIPAVLPRKFEEISSVALRAQSAASVIQIDICDGKFVPTSTWPFTKGIMSTFNDDFEMPGWEYFDFEVDLMIQNPQQYIENLKNMGLSRAILHLGSTSEENILLSAQLLDSYDIEVGLAVQNSHFKETIASCIDMLGIHSIALYVQVMGIETIGKQGEAFDRDTLQTVEWLKSTYPDITVQVDGAVSDMNVQELKEAGVERFVVGSWLTKGDQSVSQKIHLLKNLVY